MGYRHILPALVLPLLASLTGSSSLASDPPSPYRHGEAVVITGDQLPLWSGIKPLDQIFAYRYNSGLDQWTRVSLQIDERYLRRLATCRDDTTYGNVDYELSYAFDAPENDTLDLDDEVVARWEDGGEPAAINRWVTGADAIRYEIELSDPLSAQVRFLYLYTAAFPLDPDPGDDDVQYSHVKLDTLLEDTWISSFLYDAHFGARWRLDSLSVKPGAGSGTDLIDRIKFREATNLPEALGGETEETWDRFSCYQGHIDGPIRAIRGVQGAASGVNTTYFFYFYADRMKWQFNLRVHPIPNVVNMVDFDSVVTPLTYYNEWNPGGVPIDGNPDPTMNAALSVWDEAVSPTHGGVVVVREEPIPVPATNTTSYWWDDSTLADITGTDEPGRYGCPGFVWRQITDTDTPGSEARACLTFIPLPAGTGSLGAGFSEAVTNPVAVIIEEQAFSLVAGPIPPRANLDLTLRPNPMLEKSTIRYSIPQGTSGRLQVFGLSGRLIWSRTVSQSGEFSWRGRDGAGGALPPGIYWLRLTAQTGAEKLSRTIRFVKLD